MIPLRQTLRLACLVPCLLAVPALAQTPGKHEAITMYRYKNEQGTLVTSSRIPPEYAKRGYQIVNMSGAVLQEVPPEMTPEERARYEAEQEGKLSQAQQAEKDKQLLLRYSSLEELERARDRKTQEVDSKLTILEANIANFRQQLENEQQNAAKMERSGREVPPAIIKKIEGLKQELQASEAHRKVLLDESSKEKATFTQDIERYKFLNERKQRDASGIPAAKKPQ